MISLHHNEVEHDVVATLHRGHGRHHLAAGDGGRPRHVVHHRPCHWRARLSLLLLLPVAAISAEITHPLLNVTDYAGSFSMYHEDDIHPVAVVGHIAFEIDLEEELAYLNGLTNEFFANSTNDNPNLFDKLLRKTRPNPLQSTIMAIWKELDEERVRTYNLLTSLERRLPKHHPAHPDFDGERSGTYVRRPTRQKRWIPFLSLGLGVANAVHLAILDGFVGKLDHDVQKTMMKVDKLTKIASVNAEHIVKIAGEIQELENAISRTNKFTYATTVGVSLIATMQTAVQHLRRVSSGLQCLMNHQLPMEYFNMKQVEKSFDDYKDYVSPQNLEPVNLSPLQLFQNEASFVLVIGAESNGLTNMTISVLCEVPLQTKHVGLVSVYRPEETIIQVNSSGTLWNYRPRGMLLAGSSGSLAEVDDSYLDSCFETWGPQGRACPRAPSIGTGQTCLAAVYQQASNLSVCHEEMTLMKEDKDYIVQLHDSSFVSWSPRDRHVHIDCSVGFDQAQHTSHTLYGLQRIVIAPGCSLRVGDYRAHRIKEPALAPVRSFIVGHDFEALLRMLDLDERMYVHTYNDIMELSADNRHLLSAAELNLQKVQQLVQSPLHRTTSRFLPYLLFGVSSVVIIVICTILLYCCCKKWRERRARWPQDPPFPPPREKRKLEKKNEEEAVAFSKNMKNATNEYLGELALSMSKNNKS